jgi:hypothetical protein
MKSLVVKWAILSVLFTSIVFGISKCTNLPEEKVWILIDLIQRNTKQTPKEINEYIIKTPERLNARVKYDVDLAINNYERVIKTHYKSRMKNQQILNEFRYKPERLIIEDAVYYEFNPDDSNAQRQLGGVMGIRSAHVPPHPEEVDQ